MWICIMQNVLLIAMLIYILYTYIISESTIMCDEIIDTNFAAE